MRKLIYKFLFFSVLFSACTEKEDLVFDQSPEQRLDAVLSEYKDQLTKDEGQWIAYYDGYAIFMRFNADNTVEFTSNYNNGKDDRTITYRVGSSQVPELIFENHSVFQEIYEENMSENEFEFLFTNLSDDRIDFVSKTDVGSDKTTLSFFKAEVGDVDKVDLMRQKVESMSFFKSVTVAGSTYERSLIIFPGQAVLKETTDEGNTINTIYNFAATKNGLIFSPALNLDGKEVEMFTWDEDSESFMATDNGSSVQINVLEETASTKDGLYDLFMQTDFKSVTAWSHNLQAIFPVILEDIPNFKEFQVYVNNEYLLCYAPGTSGGNWAGFAGISYNKFTEDTDDLLVSWDYQHVYGKWWRSVYDNQGCIAFLFFMTDEKGLYIEQFGADSYFLVSKSDPTKYILVE